MERGAGSSWSHCGLGVPHLGLLQNAADSLDQLHEEVSPLRVGEERTSHAGQLHQARQGLHGQGGEQQVYSENLHCSLV